MKSQVKIGIIGDYDGRASHLATNNALQHAGAGIGLQVEITWIPTVELIDTVDTVMNGYDGLWAAPGSPYRSFTGALNGICYAREHHIPFLGTCGGFQHTILEFARDVLGIPELKKEDFDPYQPNTIITPLSCSLVGTSSKVLLPPESSMAKIYQSNEVIERFNCSFGLSNEFGRKLLENGFDVQGIDEDGNPRILTLKANTFFVATLFQPQLSSSPGKPHPLILKLLSYCRQ
jgi:CTP synthase (UTP-ammonia lyase)